jgi:hypothetical protein
MRQRNCTGKRVQLQSISSWAVCMEAGNFCFVKALQHWHTHWKGCCLADDKGMLS